MAGRTRRGAGGLGAGRKSEGHPAVESAGSSSEGSAGGSPALEGRGRKSGGGPAVEPAGGSPGPEGQRSGGGPAAVSLRNEVLKSTSAVTGGKTDVHRTGGPASTGKPRAASFFTQVHERKSNSDNSSGPTFWRKTPPRMTSWYGAGISIVYEGWSNFDNSNKRASINWNLASRE